jgi:hypothetical protein
VTDSDDTTAMANGAVTSGQRDQEARSILGGLDQFDDSTPLAAQLAEDARRRIALEGTTFPGHGRPGSSRSRTRRVAWARRQPPSISPRH